MKLMHYIVMVAILLIGYNANIWAQERGAKIFYVNLNQESVDVRLGDEDNYIFKMEGLESNAATYLLKTSKLGSYSLYAKYTSNDQWSVVSNENNEPLSCEVNSGKVYCIIVSPAGNVTFYSLKDSTEPGAKLCFVNGCDVSLPKMSVGKTWDDDTAYVEELNSFEITNFLSISANSYGLFWEIPEQQETDEYYYYPDDQGNEKMIEMKNNNYYLYLVYNNEDVFYAQLFNITAR